MRFKSPVNNQKQPTANNSTTDYVRSDPPSRPPPQPPPKPQTSTTVNKSSPYYLQRVGPHENESFPLSFGPNGVGRAPNNKIILKDNYVHRWHCTIDVHNQNEVTIDTHDGMNGIYINGLFKPRNNTDINFNIGDSLHIRYETPADSFFCKLLRKPIASESINVIVISDEEEEAPIAVSQQPSQPQSPKQAPPKRKSNTPYESLITDFVNAPPRAPTA